MIMKIAISGVSGFIGKHLAAYLAGQGHRIIPLTRSLFREDAFARLVNTLEECDVLINLAGAPIGRRWTRQYKQEMYRSRVEVTSRLVSALKSAGRKPRTMISASATGYYPPRAEYDEYHTVAADGFLASLCRDWEAAAAGCPADTRLVIARLGVVLSPEGGALRAMAAPVLHTKLSVVPGSGKQAFPWIAMQDVCRAFAFFIEHRETAGVYNLVSPQRISLKQLASALAKAYRAWAVLPVPSVAFRSILGERISVWLGGQNVYPLRLLEAGFGFSVPTVEHLLGLPDVRTVMSLDIDRYAGLWYEIARYENSFECGMTRVTATYTLRPDGKIRVENAGYKNGVKKHAVGRAYCPDTGEPGRLKVAFFLWFYSDYYVLELDEEDYGYALVGSSSDKYLWILSRTPVLPPRVLDALLASARKRGYDTRRMLFAPGNLPMP